MKTRFVLLCPIILIVACSTKTEQVATADFEAKAVSAVSQPSPQQELTRFILQRKNEVDQNPELHV